MLCLVVLTRCDGRKRERPAGPTRQRKRSAPSAESHQRMNRQDICFPPTAALHSPIEIRQMPRRCGSSVLLWETCCHIWALHSQGDVMEEMMRAKSGRKDHRGALSTDAGMRMSQTPEHQVMPLQGDSVIRGENYTAATSTPPLSLTSSLIAPRTPSC